MAKAKNSWRSRGSPVEEHQAGGPERVSQFGRKKLFDALGQGYELPYEEPGSVRDWSAADLPRGGETHPGLRRHGRQKVVPPRRGDPGPM